MESPIFFWALFHLVVLGLLALDLGVFHRKAHVVSIREALAWTVVWVVASLGFNAYVFLSRGQTAALEFFTGYLIEKSLSVDNIFVFALLFSYFGVHPAYQHRVLLWGVLGALVMRGALILAGAVLIARFHWIIFVFGGLLVVSGIKMARYSESKVDPGRNPVVRLFRRFVPVSHGFQGERFWTRVGGRLVATPLLVVLVAVETTDLVFAVDSIPAIFAITADPYIVYTSNVFAVLGLRALYFALAGAIGRFRYLKPGLALVLIFVGVKMLISDLYKVPTFLSLAVVAAILAAAVVVSLVAARRQAGRARKEVESR